MDWNRAVFVDFEAIRDARGRHFPIEIGVATVHGHVQSRWISPRASWLPATPDWPQQAAYLSQAHRHGVDADRLAQWVVANLKGRPLVSDAVFVEDALMARLIEGTGEVLRFREFFQEVQELAKQRGLSKRMVDSLIVEVDESRGAAHRAGEDARVRAELVARMLAPA